MGGADHRNLANKGSALVFASSKPQAARYVLRPARITLGLAVAAVSAVSRALDKDTNVRSFTPVSDRSTVSLMPGAALGLTANMVERCAVIGTRVTARPTRFLVRATNPFVRVLEPLSRRIIVPLHEEWQKTIREASLTAGEFAANLENQAVGAVLESLDIVALIRERIDLNSLVDQLDIERIVERIDPNVLAGRIDVDHIIARLDIDAVISRVDLVALVHEVLDEIDLSDLIRESTGTLTADAIEEVRYATVGADQIVARVVDRVIRRDRRNLDAPGDPTSLSDHRDENPS